MEYAIHTLLSRTAHVMRNYLRPHLGKLGLSTGQPKVLRCLDALGPCSQRVLADYCEVDPAAICRMLEGMERDGLLERRPSRTGRRGASALPMSVWTMTESPPAPRTACGCMPASLRTAAERRRFSTKTRWAFSRRAAAG